MNKTDLEKYGIKLLRCGGLRYVYSDGRACQIRHSGRCKPVLSDPQNIFCVRPDLIGWFWGSSFVLEIKTSRADFLRDKKKKAYVGEYFYYLAPDGLIDPHEIESWMGLYQISNDGEILRTKAAERRLNHSKDIEIAILLSIVRGKNRNKQR